MWMSLILLLNILYHKIQAGIDYDGLDLNYMYIEMRFKKRGGQKQAFDWCPDNKLTTSSWILLRLYQFEAWNNKFLISG